MFGKDWQSDRREIETPLQRQPQSDASPSQQAQASSQPNRTSLPDNLKTGIENLSGIAMDDSFTVDEKCALRALEIKRLASSKSWRSKFHKTAQYQLTLVLDIMRVQLRRNKIDYLLEMIAVTTFL